VTDGHDVVAKAAEEAKMPSRAVLWVLQKLGYKGPDPAPPLEAPHHGAPSHPKSPHPE